jgi:hypothetical protein
MPCQRNTERLHDELTDDLVSNPASSWDGDDGMRGAAYELVMDIAAGRLDEVGRIAQALRSGVVPDSANRR